jgi:thiol:disulfide interchange protein
MVVLLPTTQAEFDKIVKENKGVIVDFFADW